MHPVELNAYRMTLRNGAVTQVRKALCEIEDREPEVPSELLTDIIATLRARGKTACDELSLAVHKLIGKTRSMDLYQMADELGYLEAGQFLDRKYINGKVNLFVTNRFYHPEIEPLVLDELHLWLELILYNIRERYVSDFSDLQRMTDRYHEYDARLKYTVFFKSPYYPVKGILEALRDIGSYKAREALLAPDYNFRPRLNDYLVIERTLAERGDERAIPESKPEDDVFGVLNPVNVYGLRGILDWMLQFARAEPPSVASNETLSAIIT
jgi:hypothetical protein